MENVKKKKKKKNSPELSFLTGRSSLPNVKILMYFLFSFVLQVKKHNSNYVRYLEQIISSKRKKKLPGLKNTSLTSSRSSHTLTTPKNKNNNINNNNNKKTPNWYVNFFLFLGKDKVFKT